MDDKIEKRSCTFCKEVPRYRTISGELACLRHRSATRIGILDKDENGNEFHDVDFCMCDKCIIKSLKT